MPRQTRAGHGGGCSDGRASRRTRPLASVASLAAVGLALGIAAPAGAQARGGRRVPRRSGRKRTDGLRPLLRLLPRNDATGAVHGPDLTGPSFLSNWGSQTAAALYEYVRAEMPPGLGGSLPSGTYLSIVAYLLQVNGHAAGPQALTADAAGIVGEPGAAPVRGAPATADASDAALADEPPRRGRRAGPPRVRQPRGLRLHPGHRRAAPESAGGGLADLAAHRETTRATRRWTRSGPTTWPACAWPGRWRCPRAPTRPRRSSTTA